MLKQRFLQRSVTDSKIRFKKFPQSTENHSVNSITSHYYGGLPVVIFALLYIK